MTAAPPPADLLREYLGRVRSHLPVGSGDTLRELESSILDRADGIAADEGRDVDADVMRRALDQVGDPEALAFSWSPRRHLVPPEQYRAFLVWTALVFAVHMALVGVATAAGRALHFGPVGIAPVGPHGVLSVAAAAVHALLVSTGLTVLAFATAPRLRRYLRPRAPSFGVDVAPRTVGGRALLSVLVGLVLVLARDHVFVVMDGPDAHPLLTPYFGQVLPLLLGVLGLAVASDAFYLALGERRLSLAVDAFHGVATLAVLVHLTREDPLLEIPPVPSFDPFRLAANEFLGDLGTLVLLTLAAVAAVKTVRRLVRFSQI